VSSSYRDRAEAFARTLIDTPFHHAARVPGVGIDCVGVVVLTGAHIGAWPAGFDVLPYPEVPTKMHMRSKCREFLRRIHYSQIVPGDVVLLISDRDPQHVGVVGRFRGTHHLSVIHASNAGPDPRVIETPLMFGAGFRFCEAYSFPEPA
jgi:hypothetical protein